MTRSPNQLTVPKLYRALDTQFRDVQAFVMPAGARQASARLVGADGLPLEIGASDHSLIGWDTKNFSLLSYPDEPTDPRHRSLWEQPNDAATARYTERIGPPPAARERKAMIVTDSIVEQPELDRRLRATLRGAHMLLGGRGIDFAVDAARAMDLRDVMNFGHALIAAGECVTPVIDDAWLDYTAERF
ncbi:MAG TPA: hypothetical protein VLH84_02230 [Patescibacteria group bacterium]|nr:hypothetical protein [Patescibacteria group bacterium]